MKFRLYHYLLFFWLITYSSFGQNVLTDNYHFNYLGLSPAFTGERGNYGFSVLLGNQFNGTLRPNQVSQIFSVDGIIKDGPSAIGFQGYRNAYGNLSTSGFSLSYAYGIETSSNIDFKIGADVGFLVLPNTLNNEILQRFSAYGGLGFLAKGERWFTNVSSPTLLVSGLGRIFLSGQRFNIISGYLAGNSDGIAFAPSIYIGLNSQEAYGSAFHANLKLWLYDRFVLGASLRSNTINNSAVRLVSSIEYNLNGSSRFGLSYDPLPTDLSNVPNPGNFNPAVIQLLYRYDLELGENRKLLNWF